MFEVFTEFSLLEAIASAPAATTGEAKQSGAVPHGSRADLSTKPTSPTKGGTPSMRVKTNAKSGTVVWGTGG